MRLDTPVCDFGWRAPEFTLKDGAGQSFTMTEHLGEKGLLIAFICNHCPYIKAMTDRLPSDMQELQAAGVNVLAVMSNDYVAYPDDSPEEMVKFSQQHGFSFPYLVDEDQSVAKAYGAVCTPDFFGLNRDGELQYRGRLDDQLRYDSSRSTKDLVDAMLQIADTGTGPAEQFPSMGCSIKWREAG